jgi:hypothetical protein
MMYSSARAEKMVAVSGSLRTYGTRHSDQGEVWDNIAAKASRLDAHSTTGAADAIYETHRATTAEYRRAFSLQRGQIGALFGINGRMAGIELFDSDVTFARTFDKVVTSYAIDAIDVETVQRASPSADAVKEFLQQLGAARVESFKAVGEGHDLRIESHKVVGAALQFEDRLVHLRQGGRIAGVWPDRRRSASCKDGGRRQGRTGAEGQPAPPVMPRTERGCDAWGGAHQFPSDCPARHMA